MDASALTEMHDGVRGGKPCFAGTRVAVYDVLEYLAGGAVLTLGATANRG